MNIFQKGHIALIKSDCKDFTLLQIISNKQFFWTLFFLFIKESWQKINKNNNHNFHRNIKLTTQVFVSLQKK